MRKRKLIILATHSAPEVCKPRQRKTFASKYKGRRGAERRKCIGAAPHIQTSPLECAPQTSVRSLRHLSAYAAAGLAEPARLPALRGGSCRSDRTLRSQPGPCFTRPRGRRRYPRRRPRLNGAPRAPVLMPAGTMPGPPGCGVCRSARRNRSRSALRSTLAKGVPHDSMSGIGAL